MARLAMFVVLFAAATASAQEFTPLFNGRDLAGWAERDVKKGQEGRWRVESAILKAKAGSGWLSTTEQYGDFVLRVEWKIGRNGNSGIFFRVPNETTGVSPSTTGFEIQILDDEGPDFKGKLKPYQYCGGLYHFQASRQNLFRGAGTWNSYQLTVKGTSFNLMFNGEKALEADLAANAEMKKRPLRGYIGLQNHGSDVEFRKITIQSLDR